MCDAERVLHEVSDGLVNDSFAVWHAENILSHTIA